MKNLGELGKKRPGFISGYVIHKLDNVTTIPMRYRTILLLCDANETFKLFTDEHGRFEIDSGRVSSCKIGKLELQDARYSGFSSLRSDDINIYVQRK